MQIWLTNTFPRASGDYPVGVLLNKAFFHFPTRERGLPCGCDRRYAARSLSPRKRGLPYETGCSDARFLLSPAQAGIAPSNRRQRPVRNTLPRVSGDYPRVYLGKFKP